MLLWKKSSTCQWFRLLTVCCQRFTHQPIVFSRCEANAYFIGSGCAGSLSFFFSGCCSASSVEGQTLNRATLMKRLQRTMNVHMMLNAHQDKNRLSQNRYDKELIIRVLR